MPSASTSDPLDLDRPVLASLTGAHTALGSTRGRVARYDDEVTVFAGVPLDHTERDWLDLAALAGPGALTVHFGLTGTPPAGWTRELAMDGVQLVDVAMRPAPDPEAVRLTTADVPEMLDLVERTRPGPFLPRTIEMGTYLGIRRDGVLAAMAGERMHPPGFTEISAVCTDPAHRGQGLGGRLVNAVAHGIRERGETPFLHTTATNAGAIRLYEALGMQIRRAIQIEGWLAPTGTLAAGVSS